MRQQVLPATADPAERNEAREAITHYEVISLYPLAGDKKFITKLRLRLETGRKHQIRVQAANAGHPLVGDRTYNPAWRSTGLSKAVIDFPRQALHAEVLSLEHPERPGVHMTWTAELPKDLRQLEAASRSQRLERG
jgi:23S rRNA pseudouridine1911/1915/1917 synthase